VRRGSVSCGVPGPGRPGGGPGSGLLARSVLPACQDWGCSLAASFRQWLAPCAPCFRVDLEADGRVTLETVRALVAFLCFPG
jgi:hypothetical protein